ncbi:Trehalose-6-phosphate synthase, partial [Aduncisulcus paluster]
QSDERSPVEAVAGTSDFVVVANRLPIDLVKLPDGKTTWKRSPGGLVTAMEPLLRKRRGAWVGWPGVPDTDVEPVSEDDMVLYSVRLSTQEVAEYYEGFSNATLWPLYHDVIVKPEYHREWWQAYVDVNRKFADATAAVAAPGATVWVQDYQLQLVPKMLRMLRPDLTIGFFLHIPFPPVELFMQMPWRTEIIRVGFRTVKVGAFPISIDSAQLDSVSRSKQIRQRAKEIRAELGGPRKILLGLLAEGRASGTDTVFVQLATPSRERVDSYKKMRGDVEQQVGHINGEFGEVGHPVVHYLHRPVPREDLIAFFVAADVMLVTPLRDGMNLVAKEYVACRSDLGGSLVLSEFTGAAAELRQSYLVNPHDIDGVKDGIES